jgi:hypothetical protein
VREIHFVFVEFEVRGHCHVAVPDNHLAQPSDQSTSTTFHEMRNSSNSAPTRARVAAFALRARGTEGAAGARADRRGTLDRAALK